METFFKWFSELFGSMVLRVITGVRTPAPGNKPRASGNVPPERLSESSIELRKSERWGGELEMGSTQGIGPTAGCGAQNTLKFEINVP